MSVNKYSVIESIFPHLISSVRLCGVLKVRVWAARTIAAGQMIHRYIKTITHIPKLHHSKEINQHQTENEINTYTQMLPVKLMWGHRCGLHITATTAIFKTDISNFLINKTNLNRKKKPKKKNILFTLSVP